eukprot:CFRG0482T1
MINEALHMFGQVHAIFQRANENETPANRSESTSVENEVSAEDLSIGEKINKITDDMAEETHAVQSMAVLLGVSLLILTIVTIWQFKRCRVRFIHETGMSIVYGIIAGAVIHFSSGDTRELEANTVFEPALFFYMLLPPIIFSAGYQVQKKHFFRNIAPILLFAFAGTIISTLFIGFATYIIVWLDVNGLYDVLGIHDCLQFGALISAVDPVTVLAIFSELHVDADLYAMVFGESVLNDAVALVLYSTITAFRGERFTIVSLFVSMTDFVTNFCGSMVVGIFFALMTSLITRYTDIKKHPVLETSLLLLMSYTTFLIGESMSLSGIVAILFCGMGQSHYTAINLSEEGQHMTAAITETLNFLAENFIFSYLGISLFTFPNHQFKPAFIVLTIVFVIIGRAINIYPLSAILNKFRPSRPIPMKYQSMLVFSGLRGAIAFALAMKNTTTEGKQVITSTTLVIVIFTVWVFGGGTLPMMEFLQIPYLNPRDSGGDDFEQVQDDISTGTSLYRPADSRLAFFWHRFDRKYMKPVFSRLGVVLPHQHSPTDGRPGRGEHSCDTDSLSGDEDLAMEEMALEMRRQASFQTNLRIASNT